MTNQGGRRAGEGNESTDTGDTDAEPWVLQFQWAGPYRLHLRDVEGRLVFGSSNRTAAGLINLEVGNGPMNLGASLRDYP